MGVGWSGGIGQDIAITHFSHPQFAQNPADARLGRNMAMLAQHRHQFGLPSYGLLANDLRQHRAARRSAGVIVDIGAEHRIWPVHKVARILHKNADGVNMGLRRIAGLISAYYAEMHLPMGRIEVIISAYYP